MTACEILVEKVVSENEGTSSIARRVELLSVDS
jgi:hypothetical protein